MTPIEYETIINPRAALAASTNESTKPAAVPTDRGNEPDPVTTRMRNTWLISHLIARTDMRALMTAAGVTKFEHLDQLVAHVPALDAASYRSQLRAEVAR